MDTTVMRILVHGYLMSTDTKGGIRTLQPTELCRPPSAIVKQMYDPT